MHTCLEINGYVGCVPWTVHPFLCRFGVQLNMLRPQVLLLPFLPLLSLLIQLCLILEVSTANAAPAVQTTVHTALVRSLMDNQCCWSGQQPQLMLLQSY
jgi:hypothetical protein